MTNEIGHTIDLELAEQLKDREFREQFFLAEASADIAAQIISLRKRRGKSQSDVAKAIGTGQPAISRVEQADYQNWSFRILRLIAGALDARLRVIIEPAEDVLSEYDQSPSDDAVPPQNGATWFSSTPGHVVKFEANTDDAREKKLTLSGALS